MVVLTEKELVKKELSPLHSMAVTAGLFQAAFNRNILVSLLVLFVGTAYNMAHEYPKFLIGLVYLILLLALAHNLMKVVDDSQRVLSADNLPDFKVGGAPLISLFFLSIIFSIVISTVASFASGLLALWTIIAVPFALVISSPLLWWLAKSSFAYPMVSLQEFGAIEAIVKSHKLIDGRFWSIAKQLALLFLFIVIPTWFLYYLSDRAYWLSSEWLSQDLFWIGGAALKAFVDTVISLISGLLLLGVLTRTFLYYRPSRLDLFVTQTPGESYPTVSSGQITMHPPPLPQPSPPPLPNTFDSGVQENVVWTELGPMTVEPPTLNPESEENLEEDTK